MSRFDFIKDVDNNLYNLCLQVEEKQNDDIDVFMLKCRRVLEYLVNLAGCEGKNLNDKIWNISTKMYISNQLKHELVYVKGLCNENIHLDNQSANNVNRARVIDVLENACRTIIRNADATRFLYECKIREAEEAERRCIVLEEAKKAEEQRRRLTREIEERERLRRISQDAQLYIISQEEEARRLLRLREEEELERRQRVGQERLRLIRETAKANESPSLFGNVEERVRLRRTEEEKHQRVAREEAKEREEYLCRLAREFEERERLRRIEEKKEQERLHIIGETSNVENQPNNVIECKPNQTIKEEPIYVSEKNRKDLIINRAKWVIVFSLLFVLAFLSSKFFEIGFHKESTNANDNKQIHENKVTQQEIDEQLKIKRQKLEKQKIIEEQKRLARQKRLEEQKKQQDKEKESTISNNNTKTDEPLKGLEPRYEMKPRGHITLEEFNQLDSDLDVIKDL